MKLKSEPEPININFIQPKFRPEPMFPKNFGHGKKYCDGLKDYSKIDKTVHTIMPIFSVL